MFPSHIGSRSTLGPQGPFFFANRFHPTLVLAQHEGRPFISHRLSLFPSHIGSRSTRRKYGGTWRMIIVSIPHWFSLNSLYYKNYTGLQGAKSNLLAKIGYRPQEPVSPHFRLPLRSTALLRKSGTDHRNRSVPIFAAAVFWKSVDLFYVGSL